MLKVLLVTSMVLTSSVALNTIASSLDDKQAVTKQQLTAKTELRAILAKVNNLSANFSQNIVDVEGELLQEGSGFFTLAKPNLLHWQTELPEESTIISDGETLWLFDPFIEQVSAYPLATSIANTPILLLTSNEESLWQQYQVFKVEKSSFNVVAVDAEAQVKQLNLVFKQNALSSFSIVDATGQKSHFTLAEVKLNANTKADLFTFTVPEGVMLDDQR
ncbi:outer membrane lipoprotein chaperone LolA [Thalassotalea sp. M1531]|uniref:Outer-membrane lipoprotein carrier protein n=1 Tax=Thalassotalea algicola TaxID=2716224 RepID=A0A7Y0LEV3_9GAMM|nr:outer membrane lipoprotein chaperone LolA [Thalassotalea algicola]NMP32386.1 outer membrane lipoprotein chaperone LolA [Thalassotalea algicola]